MHLFLSAEDSATFLLDELRRAHPETVHQSFAADLVATETLAEPSPPLLAFARQAFPSAIPAAAASINQWADRLVEALVSSLPDETPWMLQVTAHYGAEGAGTNRCRLIQEALRERLQKKRRHRLRRQVAAGEPFGQSTALIQLLLTSPEQGWLAVSAPPLPWHWRTVLSPFPAGHVPIASDKAAPSRAFAKLVEAEQRLGQKIQRGETCVDLGASPGSWSYVALARGARVFAVDRAPLRDDLMKNPALTFKQGDAFAFQPERPVDWLICDVIAAPDRSMGLVVDWAQRRLMKRFVVTIKFKGTEEYAELAHLKQALPPLCAELRLTRLCANRNEVCVFGTVGA